MTHQVLFIQGGGEGAHDKCDNRIVESLEANTSNIAARATVAHNWWSESLQREGIDQTRRERRLHECSIADGIIMCLMIRSR